MSSRGQILYRRKKCGAGFVLNVRRYTLAVHPGRTIGRVCSSIVQVEAINVDVCLHDLLTRKPPKGGFVPFRRSYLGGYIRSVLKKA